MELEDLNKKLEVETAYLLDNIVKILRCIQISKTLQDAIENYKVFCVTLKKLIQKVEVCLKGLFTRKQRNRTRLCISQISKCLPMLGLTLQQHEKYNPVESKQYIVKRLETCFLEVKNLIVNKTDFIENAEGEGSKFVHTMNAALQVISSIESHVHTESLNTSIRCVKMAVEDLLSRAMYIFQVSSHLREDHFQAACTKVSRCLQELSNECLSEMRNGTAIRFAGETLRAALEDLEHLVNTILLHLYLEVFSDPFDILCKIVKSCNNSPLPVNYRKCADLQVEQFDRHMESMLILGHFAIACSENAKRVLEMNSCVASLESLDTEMMAAMTTLYLQPNNVRHSRHVDQLLLHYKDEVVKLRALMDTVVDPATFCNVVEVEIRRLVKEYKKTISRPVADLQVICNRIIKKTEMLVNVVKVVLDLEEMQPISPEISSSITSLVELASKRCKMCSIAGRKMCETSPNVDAMKMLKRLKLLWTYVRRLSPMLDKLMNEYHFIAVNEFEKYSSCKEGESSSSTQQSSKETFFYPGMEFPNSIRQLPIDMDSQNIYNRSEIAEKKSVSVLAVEDVVMSKPKMCFNRSRYHSSYSVRATNDEEEEICQTLTFDFTEILENLSCMPDTLTSDVVEASHSTDIAQVQCDEESGSEDVEMLQIPEEQEDQPGGRLSVKQRSMENVRTFHSSNQSSKILKFIRKKYCRFRKMYRSKSSVSKLRCKIGKLAVSKQSGKRSGANDVVPSVHGQLNGHLCSPSSSMNGDRCSPPLWGPREKHLNGVPFCESVMNCSIREVNPQTFKDLCCAGNVCSLESNRRHCNHTINKQSSDALK